MVGVVVGQQKGFAQNRLPIAERDPREQIGRAGSLTSACIAARSRRNAATLSFQAFALGGALPFGQ